MGEPDAVSSLVATVFKLHDVESAEGEGYERPRKVESAMNGSGRLRVIELLLKANCVSGKGSDRLVNVSRGQLCRARFWSGDDDVGIRFHDLTHRHRPVHSTTSTSPELPQNSVASPNHCRAKRIAPLLPQSFRHI